MQSESMRNGISWTPVGEVAVCQWNSPSNYRGIAATRCRWVNTDPNWFVCLFSLHTDTTNMSRLFIKCFSKISPLPIDKRPSSQEDLKQKLHSPCSIPQLACPNRKSIQGFKTSQAPTRAAKHWTVCLLHQLKIFHPKHNRLKHCCRGRKVDLSTSNNCHWHFINNVYWYVYW